MASKRKKHQKAPKRWHATYLNSTFMLASIIGFFVSYYLILDITYNFGVAFMILFLVMFIASIVSMTSAPIPKNPARF